jgi:hypothetical protein
MRYGGKLKGEATAELLAVHLLIKGDVFINVQNYTG